MKRLFAVLLIVAAFAVPGGAQAQEEETDIGTREPGDNDPRITPEEVKAPSLDSTSPEWKPFHEWHSGEEGEGRGADSLDCGGRRACQDSKENQTAGGN